MDRLGLYDRAGCLSDTHINPLKPDRLMRIDGFVIPKVLISNKPSPNAVDIFVAFDVDMDVKTSLSSKGLQSLICDYDGLIIGSATRITEKLALAEINGALPVGLLDEIKLFVIGTRR